MGHDLAALLVIPRAERLPMIAAWNRAGHISRDQLRALLAEWWSDTEHPSAYGVGAVVSLFRAAGFVTDTPGTEPPAGPLTIYRGISSLWGERGERTTRRGVSWTEDREQAVWFARRFSFNGPGTLLTAEVSPEHVLGIFHGRGEVEVVVDPRRVRRVRSEPVPPRLHRVEP